MIAGAGREESNLREFVERHKLGGVRLLGAIPREQVIRFCEGADLVGGERFVEVVAAHQSHGSAAPAPRRHQAPLGEENLPGALRIAPRDAQLFHQRAEKAQDDRARVHWADAGTEELVDHERVGDRR